MSSVSGKRITMLSVLHEPYDKRMYHKLAKSLVSAGYRVTYICPVSDNVSPKRDFGVEFIVYGYRKGWIHRLRSIFRIVRLGWNLNSDLYIAPEPESWLSALVLKIFRRGKVVFDMHEHNPNKMAQFFPSFLHKTVEWITTKVMRLMARFTDLIILTRSSFDDIWKGLSTPRITVINTNHLQPVCKDIPEELIKEYGVRNTIIHEGVFGTIRGSYQLLEAVAIAVKKVPDLCCIILGEYVYGSEEEYRKSIRERGLQNNIHLLGVVPFEEVPKYIRVSKIGLIVFQPGYLNHTLAMPHKLFDYMREEIPVIVPDFAIEVSRIVKESKCGLCVDVSDPQAIADAIVYLLTHPEESEEMGKNGRKAIETRYNWQREEGVLLEGIKRALYESLDRN
ncbi:MAG: glycosyltransferase family 4 protein [Candidatus Hydrogenedentes bacterium]|nr:glycosyltransferase family 4 protein [Candidatus Hydrogenedentota bacterium]